MPFVVPLIPALIGAAVGGTELGLQATSGGGGGNQQQILQQQEQQQSQQDALAKQKAIQANLANSQSQTGGDVNNPTLVDLASIISGLPGEAGSASGKGALAAFLGTPTSSPGAQDNLVSSTYGINGGQG